MNSLTPGSLESGALTRQRVCAVYNPTAGRRRRKRLNAVLEELGRQGAIVELLPTTAPGDATRFAAACKSDDWDVLVAAGGDGTLNEVINGRRADGPPVALIPLGTANVAAMEIGIPKYAPAIADMIMRGQVRPAYLGDINGTRFLLMSGVGFDAHVVKNTSPRLKKVMGKGAYAFEVLRRMIHFRFPDYNIVVDGRVEKAASAIVAKGHFYAGPHICAPSANFDTEGLYICLFRNKGRWQVVRYGLALLSGRLPTRPDIDIYPAKEIEITAPGGEPVQIDGDSGPRTPVMITVVEQPVPLIRPMP